MFHSSSIEISKSALKSNINFIRRKLLKGVKFSAVVKGNAYGHGIEQFVPLAESLGIHHFSVFSAQEAYQLLKVKKAQSTIMLMGMIENECLAWAITHDIQFYIFEFDRLKAAIASAKKLGKKAIVHIELETGMNRTGFSEESLDELAEMLKENEAHLQIEGLCTHYAGAESIGNYVRVINQYEKFNELYQQLLQKGIQPKIRHTACSAATINYPETQMDMVRIGILLYGFWPSRETFIYYLRNNGMRVKDPLRRVISWKSKVMDIKQVKVSEFIGYGTSYQAPKDIKVAIVPVGYAYGFSRSLSNLGRVLIHGKRAPVVGIVNMNAMTINVNEIKEVKKGDEVILIGKQKKLTVSVASFGELSNQLNYELLTRLPADLPRTIVD